MRQGNTVAVDEQWMERTSRGRPVSLRKLTLPMHTETSDSAIDPSRGSPNKTDLANPQTSAYKTSWKHLFAFTDGSHALALVPACIATAGTAAFKTYLAVAMGDVFNIVTRFGGGTRTADDSMRDVSHWGIILVTLGVGNWIASSSFLALWLAFGELQAHSVRKKLMPTLLSKEAEWFDKVEHGISSLLVRVHAHVHDLQLATSQVLGLLLADVLTSVGSLIIAFWYSWKLTLVLLATLPPSILILRLIARGLEPSIQEQKCSLAAASKHVGASMTAIDLVKVFDGYEEHSSRYATAINQAALAYMKQARCSSMQVGYVSFLIIAMFIVGFWYGLVLVDQGLPPGHVLTTFYATLASFQGIEALMPQWLVVSKGMSAGAFLSRLLKEHALGETWTTSGSTPRTTLEHIVGALEAKNVTFTYPGNPHRVILDSCTFYLPAGETTFLVGRSGSGKSTLGSLLASLYIPSDGEIRLDGYPLQSLEKPWFRSNVTMMQQTSSVFNDTLFHNVALGHPQPDKVTRGEVIAACEAALLRDTLSEMPNGLDTRLGLGGHKLSGGQMQRLALARALLRNPPVLILDEATSGLDIQSKSNVLESILAWRANKTTLIITHDVSVIKAHDYVYIMDAGRIVQRGFRRDLDRDQQGLFATLTTCQNNHCLLVPTNSSAHSPDPTSSARKRSYNHPGSPERLSLSVIPGLTFESTSLLKRTSLSAVASEISRPRAQQSQCSYNHGRLPTSGHNSLDFRWDSGRFSQFCDHHFALGASHADERPYGSEPGEISGDTCSTQSQPSQEVKTVSSVRKGMGQPAANRAHLRYILATVWPSLDGFSRFKLLLGLFHSLLAAAATPAFSYCFAQLLSVMWSPGDRMHKATPWTLYLTIIAIVDGIATGLSRYFFESAAETWVNSLRRTAYAKILRQPKAWFDRDEHSPGRIAECLDHNSEEMRNIVGRFVPLFSVAIGMITISVMWSLLISWKLSLVALSPLPLFLGSVKGYSIISGRWEILCNQKASDVSASWTEALSNFRVVKAFTLEKAFQVRCHRLTADAFKTGLQRAVHSCWLFGLYQSINYPITALVFYYGARLMTQDSLGTYIDNVVQVINLILFGMGTAAGFLSNVPQLVKARTVANELLQYTDHHHIEDASMPYPRLDTDWRDRCLIIDIQHLQFKHPDAQGRLTLKDVCLQIRTGECVAIVGRSGAGKSTILASILGLYGMDRDIPECRQPIRVHDTGTGRNVDLAHFRQRLAYVPQDAFIFPATIHENIAYGLPARERSRCRVHEVATMVGMHDFISSLAEGYETLVGDGGQALSGGQAQRLCIARALMRQPLLLVMDEPTSALDAESADVIRRMIGKRGSMAVLLATHSPRLMRVADCISVLDQGHTVQTGTYQELLLDSDGVFSRLIEQTSVTSGG